MVWSSVHYLMKIIVVSIIYHEVYEANKMSSHVSCNQIGRYLIKYKVVQGKENLISNFYRAIIIFMKYLVRLYLGFNLTKTLIRFSPTCYNLTNFKVILFMLQMIHI